MNNDSSYQKEFIKEYLDFLQENEKHNLDRAADFTIERTIKLTEVILTTSATIVTFTGLSVLWQKDIQPWAVSLVIIGSLLGIINVMLCLYLRDYLVNQNEDLHFKRAAMARRFQEEVINSNDMRDVPSIQTQQLKEISEFDKKTQSPFHSKLLIALQLLLLAQLILVITLIFVQYRYLNSVAAATI